MISIPYVRAEFRRVMRTPRILVFSVVFPLIFFFSFAFPQRHDHDLNGSGIPVLVYYFISLAGWGSMGSMTATGGRIAQERRIGWNRQLRITPLKPLSYISGKVVVGFAMSLLTMLILLVVALASGARFDTVHLIEAFGLMLVALVPFAMFGVALGHVASPDVIGPVMGGVLGLLPIVSGTWVPVPDHGTLHDIALVLPSYWLVQAGHIALGSDAWGARGWVTIAIWSLAMTRLAMFAYRRDTQRQ